MKNTPFPLLFCGTAEIGALLLKALAHDGRFELKQVITSPDRPAGRKLELTPPPLKEAALKLNLPVFQPEKINSPEVLEKIQAWGPVAIVVMAYGQLFKPELLDLPPQGCLNIHTSLLPKYRGASPIQSALLHQEKVTGVSLMRMVKAMDAGPIFSKMEVFINPTDNTLSLTQKLAQETAEMIPDALYEVLTRKLEALPQKEEEATYCEKIKKEEGQIDWKEDAEILDAKIRAFYGWPGSYSFFEGKRLKIIRALPQAVQGEYPPGRVYRFEEKILIQTGLGSLEPLEVQLEGRKQQSLEEFLKGNKDFLGVTLGL